MYIVKSGPYFGRQVYPCSMVPTNSQYPNHEYNDQSDQFFLSTSFSYRWSDNIRPRWHRSEVEEISGNIRFIAIVNHGSREEAVDCRYFDMVPVAWLKANMDFRSQYNPYLAGLIDDPNLAGWLCAWEWENEGNTNQIRLATDGSVYHCAVRSITERMEKYKQAERAATRRTIATFENDAEHRAWQDSMRRQ